MPSALWPATATRTVALVGNPNTGKTTLFNSLTGLSQRIGNYPGVTIERKLGRLSVDHGQAIDLVDLPGAYSLAAQSPDELLAVDVLLGRQDGVPPVDAVLAIVDASDLRRNLYLLSQVLEAGLPVVVALNMVDLAHAGGIQVDAQALSDRLGTVVVPICASRGQGLDELRAALARALAADAPSGRLLPAFPRSMEQQVEALQAWVDATRPGARLSCLEALRLLVDEEGHVERRLLPVLGPQARAKLTALRRAAAAGAAFPLSALEAHLRYAWIDGIVAECVQQPHLLQSTRSDQLDRVLTHRVLGTLAFLAINALVFQGIFRGAGPLMGWIDQAWGTLGEWIAGHLGPGPLQSLLVDGLVAGVGGVLVFLPQIAILFFFIALLEDFGYMARAALLMDRLLTRCGLSGKSFIPLLSCFACAVPGIMATRTIEDRRDRLTTILVAPLMSCSARLPVYTVFTAAFIPDRALLGGWVNLQGLVLLLMYTLGIVVAVPLAWLFKKTLLRGQPPPFLLELPSYKRPSPRTVGLRVYHSSRSFVVRAGGIILATTVLMWGLAYFPRSAAVQEHYALERARVAAAATEADRAAAMFALERAAAGAQLEQSVLGRAGRWLEPVFQPLGWDWRIGVATLASLPAREVVISVLGTIFSMDAGAGASTEVLGHALQRATRADGSRVFGIPVALSVMVFFALCAQCVSTLATIQRETRSWAWTAFCFAYLNLLAYAGALVTYQGATWLGWGG